MSPSTAQNWLKSAGIVLVVVGVFFSWVTSGAASAVNVWFVDLVFWPLDGQQTYEAVETKLLSGIAGGLTVGLGLAIWIVAREILPGDPALARRIILTFMMGWFVVDSVGSVLAGAWFNVVPNVAILIGVCSPVLGVPRAEVTA